MKTLVIAGARYRITDAVFDLVNRYNQLLEKGGDTFDVGIPLYDSDSVVSLRLPTQLEWFPGPATIEDPALDSSAPASELALEILEYESDLSERPNGSTPATPAPLSSGRHRASDNTQR